MTKTNTTGKHHVKVNRACPFRAGLSKRKADEGLVPVRFDSPDAKNGPELSRYAPQSSGPRNPASRNPRENLVRRADAGAGSSQGWEVKPFLNSYSFSNRYEIQYR